jgi:hypothetical protein
VYGSWYGFSFFIARHLILQLRDLLCRKKTFASFQSAVVAIWLSTRVSSSCIMYGGKAPFDSPQMIYGGIDLTHLVHRNGLTRLLCELVFGELNRNRHTDTQIQTHRDGRTPL